MDERAPIVILWHRFKHHAVQIVAAVVIAYATIVLTDPWLPQAIHWGVCNFVIGPC